jgi:hypothetical protein
LIKNKFKKKEEMGVKSTTFKRGFKKLKKMFLSLLIGLKIFFGALLLE